MCEVSDLSIVIPAWNEAARIALTLEASAAYLERRGAPFELIVVDDCSRDATPAIVEEVAQRWPQVRLIRNDANRGKGYAVRQGMREARRALVGYMDADYKVPIDQIEKIVPRFDEGFDVVFGSRGTSGAVIEVAQPLYRRVGSRAFGWLMHTMVGLGHVVDSQCGFKFFTQAAAARLFSLQRVNGYLFDVELLCLAELLGMRGAEVPITWVNDPDSRLRLIRGNVQNLLELVEIRRTMRSHAASGTERALLRASLADPTQEGLP